MSFTTLDVQKEIETRKNSSESFRKKWDDSRDEYRLIGEMISLRKQHKITQKQLAIMTNNKQQSISRIENKEINPSLGLFCKLIRALGYELKIEKRKI